MGHRPVFRQPRKEGNFSSKLVKPPCEPAEVKLAEKQLLEEMVRTGMGDEKVWAKEKREEPVVGYTGFLKGVKA